MQLSTRLLKLTDRLLPIVCQTITLPCATTTCWLRQLRLRTTNAISIPTAETMPTDKWQTIYCLPLIRAAAAFNRLKIYQAGLTIVGTPFAYALAQADYISNEVFSIYGIIGITGMITLTISSYALQNLIGFIYINETNDKLRIAYVDFWGRRQQRLIDVDDLLVQSPEWEQKHRSRFNFYQPVSLYSDNKVEYKLLQRFGNILEPQIFVGLFGE